MWLTKQLFQDGGAQVRCGLVAGEEGVDIQGESEFRSPEQVLPYGVASRACEGEKTVMLDGYCAGVPRGAESDLEPGEVRLYSAGGAEILLKNNGNVVINGQLFSKE